ncbi:MAG: PQQ-dependent sugar dehydrogenase [Spirochaetales bacterium]|uniref:PQQ-dependent sugar dehydrogenase n=1 Tax=Candidatus Thalassospirochaeta sargassi TaxID=3119039 RepID=A0AAJ1IGG3_9SPIO|nr:PQQ-dependent sugar dehydrogenase [Spirochaetales bacterium]
MRYNIFNMFFILVFILVSFSAYAQTGERTITGTGGSKLYTESFGTFDEPWAMTFLPDGNLLVTEKAGRLLLVDLDDLSRTLVMGIPDVAYGGQGGLGDVILHPRFDENQLIYLSYAEADGPLNRGAVVIRGALSINGTEAMFDEPEIIWRQYPTVSGNGHYSHRLAFDPDGYLFITSGERQKMEPAQSWEQNLGKIIRLHPDGSIPRDNPFQNRGELARSFWTMGHRNLLGIAFDADGKLWTHEMGPRHGDEFNLIIKGGNYGWPVVSWGNHYSGKDIPDHNTRPDFHSPEVYWVPTIAPSGLIIYNGSLFREWQGNAFIGGLKSEALIRVFISGDEAEEIERFDMEKRIREVEEGPDGAIWVLEDNRGGRLLRLTPAE